MNVWLEGRNGDFNAYGLYRMIDLFNTSHDCTDIKHFTATGLEEMAKLRSELESLQEKIVSSQEEEVQKLVGLVNSCVEKCRLSFDKVGKEIQGYEQNVRLLKEEKDSLSRKYQRLNITEGVYSACKLRILMFIGGLIVVYYRSAICQTSTY